MRRLCGRPAARAAERIALSADSTPRRSGRAPRRRTLLGAARPTHGEQLSLTLTDDPAIRELNAQWRAVDAPTDVLSFPMDDPQLLGDLVISIDTAGRQAHGAQPQHPRRAEGARRRKSRALCFALFLTRDLFLPFRFSRRS